MFVILQRWLHLSYPRVRMLIWVFVLFGESRSHDGFKQFFIFLALKENVYSWFVLFGYVEKQTIIRTFSKQNGYNWWEC